MSVTIDVTGLRPERVAVAPSPLAELGMALHTLSEPGHHPRLQGWVAGVTARLDPHLADRMCEAEFLWRTTFSDLFLACAGLPGGAPLPGRTLAADLDLLDKLSDEQFVAAALEFTSALPCDSPGPGPLADAGLRRRALKLAAARGPRQLRFSERLLAEPPRIRAWLREFLLDCDEAFFAESWSRLSGQLAADARHKTELLRRKGLAQALSAVSPAVTLDETAGRISVDKISGGPYGHRGRRPAAGAHPPGVASSAGGAPVGLAAGAALPGGRAGPRRPALGGATDPADDRTVPPGADAAVPQPGPQRVHHQ